MSGMAPVTPSTPRGASRQKPMTPREVSSRQGTPRTQEMDPKITKLVWTSLKDRIYQRSHNLRHTFRELDAKGTGNIPFAEFIEEMGRAYQLTPVEKQCLGLLLKEVDLNRDGRVDFLEFCEMLKSQDKNGMNELTVEERKRFDRCVMDRKMQAAVMRDNTRPIRLKSGLPTNELGSMTIDCPFGVLGDSERMDAVTKSFLNVKEDKMRETFKQFDTNHNGRVSYAEFKTGMQNLDPYIFDEEIQILIEALDRKRKGYILVEEFVQGVGQEYLKKKAHRSQAIDSPFTWPDQPVAYASIHLGQRGRGPCKKDSYQKGHESVLTTLQGKPQPKTASSPTRSPRGPARTTRAQELRAGENKVRVTDIYKREDGDFAARVNAGTSASIPRPPPILGLPKRGAGPLPAVSGGTAYVGNSPRLPSIKSARGGPEQNDA